MKEETLQLITEIQRIIKDYEKLHANQLNSLEKTDKFLETYNLSVWSHEKNTKFDLTLTSKKTDLVIKNQRKVQFLMATLINSIKHLQKNECQSFSKCSKKLKKGKYFQTHFYGASITLMPKPNKNTTREKKK